MVPAARATYRVARCGGHDNGEDAGIEPTQQRVIRFNVNEVVMRSEDDIDGKRCMVNLSQSFPNSLRAGEEFEHTSLTLRSDCSKSGAKIASNLPE